jgi:hypothetical protein
MVMLNLIIAIMGDTYDRVQAGMEVADAKELTLLIIEIESIMFWQRINREAKYLHYCYPREIAQADYNNKWSGKIMVLRKAIKDIELRIKSNDKKIDAFGGAIKEMRDELIIVQNRNEKTLEQQINSLKSTLLNPRHSDGSNKLQGQKDSENPNESEISSLRSEIEKLNSKLDLLLNK